MNPLFFLVLFQILWPSFQQESKRKLRLDVIVAASFVGKANETAMKNLLLLFTDNFVFDQDHTRMAVLIYDHEITHVTSLTDDRDKVVKSINAIKNRPDDKRSYLQKALAEMLTISKTKGRNSALKVFIVLTQKNPTKINETKYDYTDALPVSEEIKSNGLFFIIFDYTGDPTPEVAKYFRKLCGEGNFEVILGFEEATSIFSKTIFSKIDVGVCERRERFCSFTDASLQSCKSVWISPYLSTPNAANCPKTNHDKDPDECKIDECHQHCDQYWPWQQNPNECDVCGATIGRQGVVPFADLSHCPNVHKCQACDEQTADEGLTGWAIGLILLVVIAAIVGVAFTVKKRLKLRRIWKFGKSAIPKTIFSSKGVSLKQADSKSTNVPQGLTLNKSIKPSQPSIVNKSINSAQPSTVNKSINSAQPLTLDKSVKHSQPSTLNKSINPSQRSAVNKSLTGSKLSTGAASAKIKS